MATLKQKQTAANKILRISKKNNTGSWKEIYIKPCIDNNNNQYIVCDYMAIKTTGQIYPIEECNQLHQHNIYAVFRYNFQYWFEKSQKNQC